jgi:hypothetical protein
LESGDETPNRLPLRLNQAPALPDVRRKAMVVTMTRLDQLKWMAGYLEGRGFSILRGKGDVNPKTGKNNNNGWRLNMRTARPDHYERFQRFARYSGATMYTSSYKQGFNGQTVVENRPAVFVDREGLSWVLYLSGVKAQELLRELKPFLCKCTLKNIELFMNYEFCQNRRERGLKAYQTMARRGTHKNQYL